MSGAIASAGSALDWLLLVERELLVFAAFWFVVGLIDEMAVDLAWIGMRLRGNARSYRLPSGYGEAPLLGTAAVLIPAFEESRVIGATVAQMLRAWPQSELTIFIGCYRNDAETLSAAMLAAKADRRVRIATLGVAGPTTKADCLNRLYRALTDQEQRSGRTFASVILHDAEDMVHPCALQALDAALAAHDFVQLPVRPEIQPSSRWIAGHYSDEFAESHAKGLVVRAVLGGALPAAGVGCGFSRAALRSLAERRDAEGGTGPFAPECLTEDYELGLEMSASGRGSTFLRLRDAAGNLVATRSYFPDRLEAAVRQKTRWVHGIAFQGWDRLGWSLRPIDLWMALRDRRGPLTALVLAAAYALLVIEAAVFVLQAFGEVPGLALSPVLRLMLIASFAGFLWRAAFRAAFTAREYGWREGALAVLRIPVANIIAVMAGRRAIAAYLRSLRSGAVVWDKTPHELHPATAAAPTAQSAAAFGVVQR